MNDTNLTGVSALGAVGHLTAKVRTSLTGQYLMAATMLARRAATIEATTAVDEDAQILHRGYVVGAIMQAASALEAEVWEVMVYGPGHHLGSNGIDNEAQAVLGPIADLIDKASPLDRYQVVLMILKKTPLEKGTQPWQDAALVFRLRNELVHYKSSWDDEQAKFLQQLKAKNHSKPPHVPSTIFFPYECLSASCAEWAVRSCVAFLDRFYANLGFPDRLQPYRARLITAP